MKGVCHVNCRNAHGQPVKWCVRGVQEEIPVSEISEVSEKTT
jgi:hypothetical protein